MDTATDLHHNGGQTQQHGQNQIAARRSRNPIVKIGPDSPLGCRVCKIDLLLVSLALPNDRHHSAHFIDRVLRLEAIAFGQVLGIFAEASTKVERDWPASPGQRVLFLDVDSLLLGD